MPPIPSGWSQICMVSFAAFYGFLKNPTSRSLVLRIFGSDECHQHEVCIWEQSGEKVRRPAVMVLGGPTPRCFLRSMVEINVGSRNGLYWYPNCGDPTLQLTDCGRSFGLEMVHSSIV